MPTPNTDLAHNRDNIRNWFTAHPGYWRPKQVADALHVEEHRARVRLYNELARLARAGELSKITGNPPPGKVRPITLYGAPSGGQGGRRKADAT